ncbi:MAG: Gfo/Idh/MocA family oxidoreductase [Chloroflexi bacterium]|nr:Gfo/Idh/MocA family oxidoreductase [Chloroflexota bacterium]
MSTLDGGLVGLGVVGCGGAALDVVRSVGGSSSVRVVAVHDRDPARAEDLARRSGARIRPDLEGLLADPAVDAVYVALPHDLLAPMAVAALGHGRHVLVEKPLAVDRRGIASVRAAAAAAGRSVGVLFELRFVATVRAATDLVRSGALGAIRQVRIRTLIDKPPAYWSSGPTGRVSDPWRATRERAGGGVVMMNAIHQLDLVRSIIGQEVVRVAAETEPGVAGVEVEDVAAATLRFADGAIGSLVASAHAPGASAGETIEIDGTNGALRLGDPYADLPRLELYFRAPHLDHPEGRWIRIEPPAVDPWATAVDAFAAAIRSGGSPVPGLDDAEAALATVLALYESAAQRTVVAVRRSFDPPHDGGPLARRPEPDEMEAR